METNQGKQKFDSVKRIRSFKYAFAGIKTMLLREHNSRIHLFAAFLAIILGFLLKIDVAGWLTVIFAIGFVFTAELFNSAIEWLTDMVTPEFNEKAGKIKDFAAGAVLIAAMTALTVGIIIFLPRILDILKNIA